jgi:hypothetical protein
VLPDLPQPAGDPLEEFARWYLSNLYGNLSWVLHEGVHPIRHGIGLTIFRSPPFQVQLFILRPHERIVDHAHPNVDSFEVYLCGDMLLTKNFQPAHEEGIACALPDGRCSGNGAMIRIPPGCIHGGWLGEKGGAFLSIQHWLNGNPVSVHEDWIGVDGSEKG